MTNQANIDEWLNRAFQLAFFLHGDRETAKKIVLGAMTKLETASNAQFKRHYYTPTGRAETTRATRSRVSLSDLQLLQRLVFIESENFEREKETVEKVCESKLLTYFIKHLVRISLKRNSFYVTLGVARILHNYTTADAMEIYHIVIQDPERVHDDYYYRSRKGVLMKELKARFGPFLETVKGARGEERFTSRAAETEKLAETALECLKFFTPWSSACALPEKFDPFDEVIEPFHFDKNDPDAEHRIEVNRIHATLHPVCFSRLTEALKLSSPQEKMEIPKFMTNQNHPVFDDRDRRNPPGLGADELDTIKRALTAQAETRKALSAGFLRVVVDGRETARFDPTETVAARFELDESAELIEVRAVEKKGEIVLATHLLSFEALANGRRTESVTLEGGQKISFDFAPELDRYGEVVSLSCGVEYAETAWRKRFALGVRRAKAAFAQPNRTLKPALSFGLLLLVLTFGWLVFRNGGPEDQRFAGDSNRQNRNVEIPLPPASPIAENSNDDKENAPENTRETNKNAPPAKAPPAIKKRNPKRAIKPEVRPEKETIYKAPPGESYAEYKVDENGILRLPIIGDNRKFDPPRAVNTTESIKSLAEIKSIYIEISGDKVLGEKIGERIAADIQNSGAFAITTDRESADAALKIYVRHESDADTREEASVAAVVRLVNAKGFVVYPNVPRVSGWKYVGTLARLPARIAGDLIRARK